MYTDDKDELIDIQGSRNRQSTATKRERISHLNYNINREH